MIDHVQELLQIRSRPLIIGHRGLPGVYPENTMPSYEAAIAARADLVELDFWPTTDGVLVCAHDRTIGRYMDESAPPELKARAFSSFTWEELSRMDFGAWKGRQFAGTRLLKLEEVLERFLRGKDAANTPILLIEHKGGTPEQTLSLLERFDAVEKVVVQSFDWNFLIAIHALAPRLCLVALGAYAITPEKLAEIRGTGARGVHWSDSTLRTGEVQLLHAAGLPLWAYTLNSESSWRGAVAMSFDGITTDRCDLAALVLR